MELPPQYNPKETEDKIYKLWEESGFFNPDNLPANGKSFCIVVPPPNITGSLHMGHALNAVIQDILIRKKRMEGYKTLWLPGADHAGIATQNVVEKELKKQGLSRHDLGKEKFIEKIWEWKEKYGNIIFDQFKKIGSSMDWSRTRFTMDPGYQAAAKEAFLHYQKQGLIYEGERVINWCHRCRTSLSDLELEYEKEKGSLWYVRYPLKQGGENKYIVVATTRPETMLGDMAVAVNPKDERYKKLVGKTAILPIQNREIPIISDRRIEIGFGTGAVKVTPAHDALDEAIANDHKLSYLKIIGEDGKITELAGAEFQGLKTKEARELVVKKLEELKLIDKVEEYEHNVQKCYRCNSTIEPLLSRQWFLKMEGLAKKAIQEVKSGKIKFHPKRWEKVYFDWLESIRDWTISRQIWWGHKIPMNGVEDVLDTWFSSALWPFAALGWPKKTKDLENFYPTQVLSTARDIINLWVARMIYSGLEFMDEKPFCDVIIHATILTKDGKRMSKSLGTGIDPMTLIEKYGADATRFGLIWQSMGGQDIHWSEEHVQAGKKFANKLWNIARFIASRADAAEKTAKPKAKDEENKKILDKIQKVKSEVSKNIDGYEFGQALRAAYEFVWHEFADKYIEYSKDKKNAEADATLAYSLNAILKLLHPFMPFVTEAIWQELYGGKKMLMVEEW